MNTMSMQRILLICIHENEYCLSRKNVPLDFRTAPNYHQNEANFCPALGNIEMFTENKTGFS